MSPEHLELILKWGLEAQPSETCGLIVRLPGQDLIRRLGNRAEDPTKEYLIDNNELVATLADVIETTGHGVAKDQVTIWHTHPSGYIGPSAGDIESKVPELHYLVVALPNGEATQF